MERARSRRRVCVWMTQSDAQCVTRTQARWSRSVRSKLHRDSRTRESAAALLRRRRRRRELGTAAAAAAALGARARRGTGCTRARTRTRATPGYRRARPIRTRAQLAESSPPRQSPPISRLICAGYVTAAPRSRTTRLPRTTSRRAVTTRPPATRYPRASRPKHCGNDIGEGEGVQGRSRAHPAHVRYTRSRTNEMYYNYLVHIIPVTQAKNTKFIIESFIFHFSNAFRPPRVHCVAI
jgi:hypothetical protein